MGLSRVGWTEGSMEKAGAMARRRFADEMIGVPAMPAECLKGGVRSFRLRMLLSFVTAILAATTVCAPAHAAERRPGVITLSDGAEHHGDLWFTNASLRIYEGSGSANGRYINCTQDELVRITFSIARKSMENRWRFKQAGSDEKEILPGQYPLIDLSSVIELKTGKAIAGHLMAQPIYLRFQDGPNPMDYSTRKFFLKYQFKGALDQTYEDLVYVKEIRFTDVKEPAAGENGEIRGTLTHIGKLEDIAAYGVNRMRPYKGVVDATKNTFVIKDLPKDVYDIAVQTERGFWIGLSEVGAKVDKEPVRALQAEDAAAIAKELVKFKDFFDVQDVLAVKGHREAAKVLLRQRRVAPVHDQPSLGSQEIRCLSVWCWHLRETEWHTEKHARAMLFRYLEEREGLGRGVELIAELGGIALDPEQKRSAEVRFDGTIEEKTVPEKGDDPAEKKP